MTGDKTAKSGPLRMLVQPHEELVGIRPDGVSTAPGQGLPPLDWQAHAVAVHADHASVALIGRRGHRLLMLTALRGDPSVRVCPCCIGWSSR